jgi:hypothetical protein
MYSKDGIEMMDVASIARDGDNLLMKGKMMGSMYAAIYMRPEDIWQSLGLLSFSVVLYLPVMLLKGMWRSFRSRRSTNTPRGVLPGR